MKPKANMISSLLLLCFVTLGFGAVVYAQTPGRAGAAAQTPPNPRVFTPARPRPTPPPGAAPAQGPAGAGGASAVPKRLTYEITAERVGGGHTIEFTPVDIRWALTVAQIGLVGPDPEPANISICPVIKPPDSELQCGEVSVARPGRTYRGTLSALAPPAGRQSPLRLVALKRADTVEDYGLRTVVAETAVPVDVAARYEVAVSSFEVISTRSTSTDTVRITLQGLIKSEPPDDSDNPEACNVAGFNRCVLFKKYADVQDGVHFVKDVRVGPYDLVPEREKDLRALFYLINVGDEKWQEIGEGVANGFSKAGMVVLGAYGAFGGGNSGSGNTGGFATQLDGAMGQLHDVGTASCNGDLARDLVVFTNTTQSNQPQNTLAAFTSENGTYKFTPDVVYLNKDGDFRCHRNGGKYQVTLTVHRTSWREWGFRPLW